MPRCEAAHRFITCKTLGELVRLGDLFVDFTRADLSGAYLSRALLSGAYLSDANLRRVCLSAADLTGALLSRANFHHSNLARADLSAADLTGADLTGSKRPRIRQPQWPIGSTPASTKDLRR